MTYVVTAEKEGIVRIEASGASATVRCKKDMAQLLFMQVPEKQRGQGEGRALLEAVEAEAAASGAKRLCCDYTADAQVFSGMLEACGYHHKEAGSVLSIDAHKLLQSEGVLKSLRMEFKNVQICLFEDLLEFEREDIIDFLKKCHYEMQPESIDLYDPKLSCVAYDEEYYPKAVLLATDDSEIFVELLMGFSKKRPEYILGVCQGFVRSLQERVSLEGKDRIYLYSNADNVISLVRRLLDRNSSISEESAVLHSEKELVPGAAPLRRDILDRNDVRLWQREAEAVFGQRNISEKALWQAVRRK